jgi:peroxiredoxin Q/BCP
LRDRYHEFKERNAEVVVIANDEPENAAAYFRRNELPFPCLADPERKVYRRYDVGSSAVSLGQRPGLFLIDRDGIVRYAYIGWQQWEIPAIEETLAGLDALA